MAYDKRNRLYLSGEIITDAKFSHETFGEKFYEFMLSVKRLSGAVDVLPIVISERLVDVDELTVGKMVSFIGQIRTHNKIDDNGSHLIISAFVTSGAEEEANPNQVRLNGYICKEPAYRCTPGGREVADILVAVQRAYGKSDYIPCIVWGRNARFAEKLAVGDRVAVMGRFQSRKYYKRHTDGKVEEKIAYEVSVSQIASTETDGESIDDIEEYFLSVDKENDDGK